ncbi:hypothetical protein MMC11_003341 [Xylographa trunciseda]|nr:hypothetical protein [Xylographa trunciseda]
MADPITIVSLVATIIQLVDFGTKLILRLREASERIGEVPAAFTDISIRLPLLIDCLNRIKNDVHGLSEITKKALLPVIESCLHQVKLLDDILVKVTPKPNDSDWRISKKAILGLSQEGKVQKIDATVKDNIQILTLYQSIKSPLLSPGLSAPLSAALPVISPIFMVPFERDSNFVGRGDVLSQIDKRFEDHSRAALAGIGGVGKSQVAIEYCYRFRQANPHSHILWIYASTYARFSQAYEEIGSKLGLPNWDSTKENKIDLVTKHLNDGDFSWFLVIDNADDMSLFYSDKTIIGKDGGSLARQLPSSSKGKILVTTRDSRVAERLTNRMPPIKIYPMSLVEATHLLYSKLPGDERFQAGAEELITELGFLPLAITQAAAFMSENFLTVMEYLNLLQTTEADFKDFISHGLEDPRRDVESESSIMRTWKLSFDHIAKQKPRAAEILYFMAVIDHQKIPKSLLRKKNEKEIEFVTALGTLQAFSLVSTQKGGEFVELHRLVQLSTQAWLELQDELEVWRRVVLLVLASRFPFAAFQFREECEMLLPHVQVALANAPDVEDTKLYRARLLQAVAWYELDIKGQWASGYTKARAALSLFEDLLQEDDNELIQSQNVLATAMSYLAQNAEAEALLRHALSNSKKESTRVMMTRNLSIVLFVAGKLEDAAIFAIQAQEADEKLHGPDHELTIADMFSLANIRNIQGNHEEARRLYQTTLAFREKKLGPDHPDTLVNVDALGSNMQSEGRLEEAEAMHRKALAARANQLGPKHPETFISMDNLANVLDEQGRLSESIELAEEALKGFEEGLGPDHPHVLTAAHGLGGRLCQAGDPTRGILLLQRACKGRENVFGMLSKDTLDSIHALAWQLDGLKRFDESEPLYRRLVPAQIDFYGPESPKTVQSYSNFAYVLRNLEKFDEAETFERKVMSSKEKTVGTDNEGYLSNVYALGLDLAGQERLSEAEEMLRMVLEWYARNWEEFSACHKLTSIRQVSIFAHLVDVLERQSKNSEVEALKERFPEVPGHDFPLSEFGKGPVTKLYLGNAGATQPLQAFSRNEDVKP